MHRQPRRRRELTLGDDLIERASEPRRVVVVGGGPGGMEAARACARAGHEVTLLEAEPALGGQLRLIGGSGTPNRPDVRRLIDFYETRLDRVDVRRSSRSDAETVRALAPDAVVVATGVTPRTDGFQSLRPRAGLPGLERAATHTGWDVLRGTARLGHRVLLLDDIGHYESGDVAERLVADGHQVHYVTLYATVAANLEMRWEYTGAPMLARLLAGDFTLHARAVVTGLGPGEAAVAPAEAPERTTTLGVDDVVLLSGGIPDHGLIEDLSGTAPVVRVIGDASSPRRLEVALVEGRRTPTALDPAWRRPFARYGWPGSAT